MVRTYELCSELERPQNEEKEYPFVGFEPHISCYPGSRHSQLDRKRHLIFVLWYERNNHIITVSVSMFGIAQFFSEFEPIRDQKRFRWPNMSQSYHRSMQIRHWYTKVLKSLYSGKIVEYLHYIFIQRTDFPSIENIIWIVRIRGTEMLTDLE
jgi:hypothetical protein